MIVLDSSALLHLFAATEKGKAIKEKLQEESIAVTSISIHEVLIGTKEEKEIWINFFKSVTILPFDAEASYKSIDLENTLRKKGKLMAKLDLFIASICLFHNLPLFTTDMDFKPVENLILSVF